MSKKFLTKGLSLAIVAILMVGVLSACGKKTEDATDPAMTAKPSTEAAGEVLEGTITASGSTALQPLVQRAKEYFEKAHEKVTINVTGGGSGTGVKNVHDGVSNIGNSDVAAAPELAEGLVDHIVTIAPFALIVNKGVGVEDLTLQQASDIFTGVTTNWSQVGGKDLAIVLVHRQEASGSRKLVKKIVLADKDFSKEGLTQESSKLVATAVGTTAGAIGYVDVPYVTAEITALKIGGVAYSSDTIKDGTYTLFGQEHMYTKGEATGVTKAFLDYIISKEFTDKEDVLALGFLSPDLLKK